MSAAKPDEFLKALKAAFATITERTSSYSNIATSSTSLDTDTHVFSASYRAGKWYGSLEARAVSASGVASTASWTASIPAWSSRKVFTFDGSAGATFPTSGQTTALGRTGEFNYPVTGTANANYLKGDRTKEGIGDDNLRERISVLGDIVNSSPVYVKQGSTETVYVGANDGMLHAFDASNGQERFAYVPGLLSMDRLGTLSSPDYEHKFFVDGPLVVSGTGLTGGQNILVGTLGRGGKGLFALDVTNPADFSASNVKWERAETDGEHMGLVLGKPILGNWKGTNAVIFGNGPNSKNEKAVLVVLNLNDGSVIKEINTGEGSTTAPNGLFAPTGVYGADGKSLVYVYAGDLQGNVWRFDVSAGTATRLFTTPGGAAQPVTSRVTVGYHPTTRKRWVFFGTGRFLTSGDATSGGSGTQSLYGFVDSGALLTTSSLEERNSPVAATVTGSTYPVRTLQSMHHSRREERLVPESAGQR